LEQLPEDCFKGCGEKTLPQLDVTYPWMVGAFDGNSWTGNFLCVGSFISDKHIITSREFKQ
jgi:hypothetical protein